MRRRSFLQSIQSTPKVLFGWEPGTALQYKWAPRASHKRAGSPTRFADAIRHIEVLGRATNEPDKTIFCERKLVPLLQLDEIQKLILSVRFFFKSACGSSFQRADRWAWDFSHPRLTSAGSLKSSAAGDKSSINAPRLFPNASTLHHPFLCLFLGSL